MQRRFILEYVKLIMDLTTWCLCYSFFMEVTKKTAVLLFFSILLHHKTIFQLILAMKRYWLRMNKEGYSYLHILSYIHLGWATSQKITTIYDLKTTSCIQTLKLGLETFICLYQKNPGRNLIIHCEQHTTPVIVNKENCFYLTFSHRSGWH